MYLLLADLVVIIHLVFILYVLFGGLLVYKWKKLIWLHVCTLAWGFYIEITGSICPLTPLEIWLRVQAGVDPYSGGFISNYLVPLIYPADYDMNMQISGIMVLLVTNAIIYSLYFWWWRNRIRKNS
ncbi:MAG: DUF2784 domain-containing protein [Gammaproteobacteria bacterium]|nr:DUF2784 domain-containing protein [Gammaproteobacteria bacterium]